MYAIALILGIYSYFILTLGLLNSISFYPVFIITFLLIVFTIFILKRVIATKPWQYIKDLDNTERFVAVLLTFLLIVNLVGALGPELAFDALWYHLTFPKIYVETGSIGFIKGNLFYYSLMPRLTEMFYAASIVLSGEVVAKVVHYSFGVLTCFAVFKLTRLYLPRKYSLLSVLVYFSSPVVSWLSITAYSDLSRAFYETLSLCAFLVFSKTGKRKYLVLFSVLLGFAVSVKLIGFGTLFVFVLLMLLNPKKGIKTKIYESLIAVFICITTALPWLLIAFYYTGNPVYPIFTHLNLREFSYILFLPRTIVETFIKTFLFSPDPISPFYLMVLPIIFQIRKIFSRYKVLALYVILTYTVWYLTSQSGGARFLTSYLPAFTVLGVIGIYELKNKIIKNIFAVTIILIAVVTILYRGAANARFVPVIFGQQTKHEFLLKNLNFDFGDFYDENKEIKKIVGDKKVLLLNMHNLFYVDFPFTLEEWGEPFQFILIQSGSLPENYKNAREIYKNKKTNVTLYKL